MKHQLALLSVSLIVIFSMVAGLTTSSAQSSLQTAKPITLSREMTTAEVAAALPRTETLYFNGQQWTPVVGWNPYSDRMNNTLAINQKDSARVTMFETPYLYNMLDGQQYPLLADGAYVWNDARTLLTFRIKPAAHWSDGTPVTSEDIVYTWASNVLYGTSIGNNYAPFINNVIAVDDSTVVVEAKLDEEGKAVNPMMVEAFLNSSYVIQKAWTQILETRTGGNPDAFMSDPAEDVVWSGPYHKYSADDTAVVLVRDDNYWGQDASMWGTLPTPKYLAHVIYPDNDSANNAFINGEVDISQMFIPSVQDLWLFYHLPVSTYFPDAPYQVGASMPTAFYNLSVDSLNNATIRKAIAFAVDYDAIIADAMTNQSATFEQVPRSLMIPSPYEQSLYDHDAVKDLQWAGSDIDGAKQLLDDAGIVDTNADGWREYNGETLVYTATCPSGWSDWQAAIEILAASGRSIGIDINTNYPDWSEYQVYVTNWYSLTESTDYSIFMMWSDGVGVTQPWGRVRHLISSEFAHAQNNWNGNWGGYINPAADALIQAIPQETDPAVVKQSYTDLTAIYLTDIPSFTLMYRPEVFHTVNESIWTGFPHQDDGTNPPVPPFLLTDGWSIAGLYDLRRVPTNFVFVPLLHK